MKSKNAIPKHVLKQFAAWGKLGGLARKKKLTALQRSTISSNAGIASGVVRRGKKTAQALLTRRIRNGA